MNRSARVWAARVLAILSLALALSGWAAASSNAATTIGELAPMQNPPAICISGPWDEVPAGPGSQPVYTVPFAGTITSWSTKAAAGEGQQLVFKVFRPVGEVKFQVLAHDGPRALAPSTVNTFPVSIPVKAGDVIGFNDTASVLAHPTACVFRTESLADIDISQEGEALDGEFVESEVFPEFAVRPNITAVVGPPVVPTPTPLPPAPAPTPTPKAHCIVPKLKGLKLKAAKRKIRAAHCAVGQVSREPDVTAKTGKVVKQKPKAGKVKAPGSKIAVTLG